MGLLLIAAQFQQISHRIGANQQLPQRIAAVDVTALAVAATQPENDVLLERGNTADVNTVETFVKKLVINSWIGC